MCLHCSQSVSTHCRLTRQEWALLRTSFGKPRRFSALFVKEERVKLEAYRYGCGCRERGHYSTISDFGYFDNYISILLICRCRAHVRRIYDEAGSGSGVEVAAELPRALRVGQVTLSVFFVLVVCLYMVTYEW